MKARPFHIGDVLSITTGRLVSPRRIDGIYSILNHMTRDNLFTHQLGRAAATCRPFLLLNHPWIEEMGEDLTARLDAATNDEIESVIAAALLEYEKSIGCSDVNVPPLADGDWLSVDPMKELRAMVGDEKVAVVVVEKETPNA